MQDYLETLITVLIGLGAFLISTLTNKKSKKNTKVAEQPELFSDFDEEETEPNGYGIEAKPKNAYNQSAGKADYTEETSSNNIAMKNKEPVIDSSVSEKKQHDSKSVIEQKSKQGAYSMATHIKKGFNARQAVIYAAIINRKYR